MGNDCTKDQTEGARSPRSQDYRPHPEEGQPSSSDAYMEDMRDSKQKKIKKEKKKEKKKQQKNKDSAQSQPPDRNAPHGRSNVPQGEANRGYFDRSYHHGDRVDQPSDRQNVSKQNNIAGKASETNDFDRKQNEEKIKKLEGDILERDNKIKEMENDITNKNAKIDKLKKEKQQLEQQQMVLTEGKDKDKLKKLLKDKEQELEQTKKDRDKQTNNFEQMRDHSRLQAIELDRLKKKENDYEEQIKTLKEEKDALMLRLSALAGAKLTDGNPDLADLSDENRPTKLAEKYSELYDNEWTEVFEYLNKNMGYDERKCTEKLLEILQICYDDCRKRADKDLDDLLRLATENFWEGDTFPIEMKKTLKDSRKKYHSEIPEDLCKEIDEHLESILKNTRHEKMFPYVTKCRSLCWLMAIQDPPVSIETRENLRPGKKFDKNFYRYYTSSGDHVVYFVWPTLYIHDGGAVLCKGVAQGDKVSAKGLKSKCLKAPPEPQNMAVSSTQNPSAPPETKNSTTHYGAQNLTTHHQAKHQIASSGNQNSTVHGTQISIGSSPSSKSYDVKKLSAGTTASPTQQGLGKSSARVSTELPEHHNMASSFPKGSTKNEPITFKQETGKSEKKPAEPAQNQSFSSSVPVKSYKTQQFVQKTTQSSTILNRPSGGQVGQSPVVRSTESFEDKKRYSSPAPSTYI